ADSGSQRRFPVTLALLDIRPAKPAQPNAFFILLFPAKQAAKYEFLAFVQVKGDWNVFHFPEFVFSLYLNRKNGTKKQKYPLNLFQIEAQVAFVPGFEVVYVPLAGIPNMWPGDNLTGKDSFSVARYRVNRCRQRVLLLDPS
ncbi:MAG: hypothetical protein AAF529_14610, partial [Pseudomonadota bacterium]